VCFKEFISRVGRALCLDFVFLTVGFEEDRYEQFIFRLFLRGRYIAYFECLRLQHQHTMIKLLFNLDYLYSTC
jgi:hypothetical protein